MPQPFEMTPQVLDVDSWVNRDGFFLDPADGELLTGHKLRKWLEADDRMMIGHEYLGEIASRSTVTVLYGFHDSGLDLPYNIESTIAKHHALGVEMRNWDRGKHEDWMSKIPGLMPEERQRIRHKFWDQRQFLAAHDAGIPTFSFDPEKNGPPLDVFINGFLEEIRIARKIGRSLTNTHKKLNVVIQELRESSWPLKFGFELHKIKDDLPTGHLNLMMSAGSGHKYLTQRLGFYGLRVKEMMLDRTWRKNKASQAFYRCMTNRRVTDKDIQDGAGFSQQ